MQRNRAKRRPKAFSSLSAALLFIALIIPFSIPSGVLAHTGDFETFDYAAAKPDTYDNSTGGGQYGDGGNTFVVESLNGGDFFCRDIVTFFTYVAYDDGGHSAAHTIEIDYEFDQVTTAGSGVGYVDVVQAIVSPNDPVVGDGDSVVSLISESKTGVDFQSGTIEATVQVTNIEPGDVVIVRVDAQLGCDNDPGTNPNGVLQSRLGDRRLTSPGTGNITGGGNQTIQLQNPGAVAQPGSITIVKDAQPDDSQGFDFTGDLGSFQLVDNGGANSQSFLDLDADSYTVTEALPVTGWTLDSIVCTGDDDNGSTVTLNAGSVDIDLDEGENITCTFTNIQDSVDPATITVTKTANPTSVAEPGDTVTFTVLIENNSADVPVTIDSLVDNVFGDLDGMGDCSVPQTISPDESYSCSFTGNVTGQPADSPHVNTVTAEGEDDNGNEVSDSDDATVTITDVPSSITVIKEANPASIAEPGGNVTFSVTVQNNSSVDTVTINSLSDDIHGDLNGQGNCSVPQNIAPNGSYGCSFSALVEGNAGDSETDTITASGDDDDGQPVSKSDDATVTITDVPSSIVVTKDATPNTVAEPGGNVTFDVTVENTSTVDTVTINSLVDDIHGDLNGQGDCSVPQDIVSGGSYSCSFTVMVSGNAGEQETDTVTASGVDDDGNPVSDDDTATVTITDVDSNITLVKTADPTSVAEPGGSVTFTVRVNNVSAIDTVTINSLTDDIHGDLNGQGTCSVPQEIAPGAFYECSFTASVTGNAGDQETDVVTASGVDDDGNGVSANDDATVTITDLPSSISVVKQATPESLPEPGGSVTFSVRVNNTSIVDTVTINSLVDSVHGDLEGQGTCAVPQEIAPGANYQCSFSADVNGQPGYTEIDIVTASGIDDDGQPVGGSDQAEVSITDIPSSINVVKNATPDTVGEPGGSVTFSVAVNNTSLVDDVRINTLTDSIYGDLNGQGTCAVPQTLVSGASYSCSFTVDVAGNAGDVEIDVVTAAGVDDDGSPVSDTDDATVTIVDVAPAVNIVKTASPSELPEPGGDVTFSFTVTNMSPGETITVISLIDSIYGDLNGQGDCAAGASLAPGEQYSCSFTAAIAGNGGDVETNVVTVTAVDDEQTEVTDDDEATVTITDVPSSVNIVKTADPVSIPESGANVTYTFTVTNTSPADDITVVFLDDSIYGNLDGQGTCSVPQTLAPGEQYSCEITEFVTGEPGEVIINEVDVIAEDNDRRRVTDEDDAAVVIENDPGTIQVEKTADTDEISSSGEDVTYSFEVTNLSAVDSITITSLVDVLWGDLNDQGNCGDLIGLTLAPGESASCSITVFVSGRGNDTGLVINTVVVQGVDDDGEPVEDSDTHVIDIVNDPPVVIPEAPFAVLFPILGLLAAGAGYLIWRRRELLGHSG